MNKAQLSAVHLYIEPGFAHMRSYVKRIWVIWNLSEIQMASRDAYQKLCGLVAGSRSSGTRLYKLILGRLAKQELLAVGYKPL